MDKEERARAGSLRPLFFLSPSHRPLCTFFFFLPSLPRTQRDLFGGESDKSSCFVFEMLLCLHVVVFSLPLDSSVFLIFWHGPLEIYQQLWKNASKDLKPVKLAILRVRVKTKQSNLKKKNEKFKNLIWGTQICSPPPRHHTIVFNYFAELNQIEAASTPMRFSFENAYISMRLGLPSTPIRWEFSSQTHRFENALESESKRKKLRSQIRTGKNST